MSDAAPWVLVSVLYDNKAKNVHLSQGFVHAVGFFILKDSLSFFAGAGAGAPASSGCVALRQQPSRLCTRRAHSAA